MTQKEMRKRIAIATFCKYYLSVYGFLKDNESERVKERIAKFQRANHVGISIDQINSVNAIYRDSPEEEEYE